MTRDTIKVALLDSLRMNRSVVFLMLAYIAFALILGRLAGFEVALQIYSIKLVFWLFLSFWIMLVPVVLLQLYKHRPASPIRFAWHLAMKHLQGIERVIIALPCFLLFPVFASTFTSVKTAIGHIHPYRFDPLFAKIDAIIHGGHAWELIHPLIGIPIVTYAISVAYNLWFVAVWLGFSSVIIMTGSRCLREQYLLSFTGCWVLIGSVAAIGLSSAGPCYYGLLYPTDPYAPLMSYLRSVNETYPIWALGTQDMLWERHIANSTGLGSGISAMPSMHVAIAALNAMLLSKLSRAAGMLGWAYVGVILVGSVHLGWHYAIDGYVSMIGVLLIWWAAGWWVARGTPSETGPVPWIRRAARPLETRSSAE